MEIRHSVVTEGEINGYTFTKDERNKTYIKVERHRGGENNFMMLYTDHEKAKEFISAYANLIGLEIHFNLFMNVVDK